MNWQKNLKGKIRQEEPLGNHTTLKIGGKARYFIEPRDTGDLKSLLLALNRDKIPFLVLGAGSNILAADKRIDKAVIRLSSPHFKKIEIRGNHLASGAGAVIGMVIQQACRRSLTGLEFLSGIPGTLGGALAMNAGAWGKNIGDFVDNVRVMDYNGKEKVIARKNIKFGYRQSSLNRYVILAASLKLNQGGRAAIRSKMQAYLNQRLRAQDLTKPSCGCVFRNPKGDYSSRLIDACGLKGKKIGDAAISLKHANFILNLGHAKAKDYLALMDFTKREVKNRFKVKLEPEVKIWQ